MSGRQLFPIWDYLPWPQKYNEQVGDVSCDVAPYNPGITKEHVDIHRGSEVTGTDCNIDQFSFGFNHIVKAGAWS